MKQAYLRMVLGVILGIGSSAYAQMAGRGSNGGNGAGAPHGGFVEHAPPASFHGNPGPRVNGGPISRNVGEGRVFMHQPPGGDGRRGFPQRNGFGDGRVFRGGLFGNGFGHGRGVVVFAYGVPYYWYPPDYGYANSGYYSAAPVYTTDESSDTSMEYTTDPDTQTEEYSNQDTDAYYQPGYQWGGELKLFHVTMDQFVTYLKSYILSASPVQQAAFRSGFVAHFGPEGQALYDQAVQEAIPQTSG
jgi:hypothetical protein